MSMELKCSYGYIAEEQQCYILAKTCCLFESPKLWMYVCNFRWPACYGIDCWWKGVFVGWRRWWKTWSLQSNVRISNLSVFQQMTCVECYSTADHHYWQQQYFWYSSNKKWFIRKLFFSTVYSNLWSICSRLQPFRKEAFNEYNDWKGG